MEGILKREIISEKPKGSVQILHGMREHSGRYLEFGEFLKKNGYSVFLSDHPYHGEKGRESGWGENFFQAALEEQLAYSREIKTRFPEVPLYVLGHSMGSFILQRYMQTENPGEGFILSGSCGKRFITLLGEGILRIFLKFFRDRESPLFEKIVFFGFDKREPNDWLSSDKKNYRRVQEDPYWIKCYPLSFYRDFFQLLNEIFLKDNLKKIEKNKRIFIFSGDEDPVGLGGKGVKKLFEQYIKIECEDVEMKLYKKGKHEMLNETNKEEVYRDILKWLNKIT